MDSPENSYGSGRPSGSEKPPEDPTSLEREQQHRALVERGRGSEAVSEFLSRKDIDPGEAWIYLSQDFLFPSEAANIPVSPYEYTPLLKECLRRAGHSNLTMSLLERAGEMESEIRDLREKRDLITDTTTEKAKKEVVDVDKEISVVAGRLFGKFVQKERDGKVETFLVEEGLTQRLNRRIEEGGTSRDKERWNELYWRIRGSVNLLDVHNQQEKTLSNYKGFFEDLFLSGFYKHEMMMSEVLAILEDKEYGAEIEESLRAYVDLHLTKVTKVKKSQYGSDLDQALEKYHIRPVTKANSGDEDEYIIPKLLHTGEGSIGEREIVAAYVKGRAAQARNKDNPRYFAAERAELIARRFLEYSLTTIWLSVPRNEDASFKIKELDDRGQKISHSFSNERLEGASSTELEKLLLAGLRWQNERTKNRAAGPKAWDWSRMPMEGFVCDFFHTKIEGSGKKSGGNTLYWDQSGRDESLTIFDLWYGGIDAQTGNKKNFSLIQILKGIEDLGSFAVERDRLGGGREKVVFSGKTGVFSESGFESWHFVMYKQSKIFRQFLMNSRGGREDCIEELCDPESLRGITKDLSTAVGGLDLSFVSPEYRNKVGPWLKLNLVLNRLANFQDRYDNQTGDLGITSAEIFLKASKTGERINEKSIREWKLKEITRAISNSHFFGTQNEARALSLYGQLQNHPRYVSFEEFTRE